jgi:methionine-R-sulfoxide reductase
MAVRVRVEQSINLLIEKIIDTPENSLEFSQNETVDEQLYQSKIDMLDSLSKKVLIDSGTEPPVFNEYNNNYKLGNYHCKLCNQLLFSSKDKYNSGTGWPSFTKPFVKKSTIYEIDKTFRIPRIEVKCSKCHSHLGHVFDDGTDSTNLRYCINSAAMIFNPTKEK